MFTKSEDAMSFIHSIERRNGGMLATNQAIATGKLDGDTAKKYKDAELFLTQYLSGQTCVATN